MAASQTQVRPGMYGVDGNDEFRVVEVNRSDVLIEYLSDSKQIRLQPNRFITQDGELKVV